jgi:hypothetical protein
LHPCITIARLNERNKVNESNNNKDDNDNLAVLHINWDGSGILEFQGRNFGGTKYRWKRVNYWHTEYTFARINGDNNDNNNDNQVLLYFKPEFKLAKLEGTVDISQEALSLSEISLLVVLGWYLLVLVGDDRTQF